MITVSNKFRQDLENGNRNFQVDATLTLSDGTVLPITNKNLWAGGFSIEDAVSDDSVFQVGSAIINQCTMVLNNIYDDYTDYDFFDAKLSPKVGLAFDDGTTEYVRKGEFTVADPQYNGSLITLTCYDNMYLFDRTYDLDIKFPVAAKTLVQQMCLKCGVRLKTLDFPHADYILSEPPSLKDTTYRTVLMWICQICGCFARFDSYGELEIKWFNQAALENPTEHQSDIYKIKSSYSKELATDDVVITGVQVTETLQDGEEDANSYLTGIDGYVVSVENNEFLFDGKGQEVATWLGNQLVGFQFRTGQITHIGDPTLEAGDVAIFTDEKGRDYKLIISGTTYTLNNSQSTRSSAENPARNSAQRYSNDTRNYVKARTAIIKERTERESAIEALDKRVDNAGGFYTTEETDSAGGKIFYLHNKPTLAESSMAWKMTAEAVATSVTKDSSGNFIWTAGITVDGDVIARILDAIGINASWINTGSLDIQDKDGNSIFSFDVDKKTANISGTTVTVNGKNVEQALKDVEENSKTLQAQIISSAGTIIATASSVTLSCEVRKGNDIVDTLGNVYRYSWRRKVDGVSDAWQKSGKSISISATDFKSDAVYTCEVMEIRNLLNSSAKQLTNASSVPLTAYYPVVSANIYLYRNVTETIRENYYTKEETKDSINTILGETDLTKVNGSIQSLEKKTNQAYDTATEHTQVLSDMRQSLNGNNLLRNSETLVFDAYIIGNRLTNASGTILTDASGNVLII